MDALLGIGIGMLLAYVLANVLGRFRIPKVVTFIGVGLLLSPSVFQVLDHNSVQDQGILMNLCLAFIAFEAGGALKWKKLKSQSSVILWVTILASLVPFILVSSAVLLIGFAFPDLLGLSRIDLIKFALILGALASPTAPATTLAVIHEQKAKGKVTNILMGVIAIDDVLGIVIFSLTLAGLVMIQPMPGVSPSGALLEGLVNIVGGALAGIVLGWLFVQIPKVIELTGEGQWVVLVFAFLIISTGLATQFELDILLMSISFGLIITNFSVHAQQIFRVLERYTEDLIYLLFFLLSGFNLDVTLIQHSVLWIGVFILFRVLGKYLGTFWGTRMTNPNLSKPTMAGGLLAQAGIVIGLVLGIYPDHNFAAVSPLLLSTIMGSTILFAFIGPILLGRTLKRVGESGVE